jgi:hypothetical protein
LDRINKNKEGAMFDEHEGIRDAVLQDYCYNKCSEYLNCSLYGFCDLHIEERLLNGYSEKESRAVYAEFTCLRQCIEFHVDIDLIGKITHIKIKKMDNIKPGSVSNGDMWIA